MGMWAPKLDLEKSQWEVTTQVVFKSSHQLWVCEVPNWTLKRASGRSPPSVLQVFTSLVGTWPPKKLDLEKSQWEVTTPSSFKPSRHLRACKLRNYTWKKLVGGHDPKWPSNLQVTYERASSYTGPLKEPMKDHIGKWFFKLTCHFWACGFSKLLLQVTS